MRRAVSDRPHRSELLSSVVRSHEIAGRVAARAPCAPRPRQRNQWSPPLGARRLAPGALPILCSLTKIDTCFCHLSGRSSLEGSFSLQWPVAVGRWPRVLYRSDRRRCQRVSSPRDFTYRRHYSVIGARLPSGLLVGKPPLRNDYLRFSRRPQTSVVA